jgi:hypothetical protein
MLIILDNASLLLQHLLYAVAHVNKEPASVVTMTELLGKKVRQV